MKKNAMMKIAAILMVAVLLTTCAISSTFAKYVTTNAKQSTEARVANWGLTITTNAPTNLFKSSYSANSKTMAVAANGTDLIIAPGTKSDAANSLSIAIAGTTPEVRYAITTKVKVDLQRWEANGAYYCPLVFKVNGTAVDTTGITTADAYEAAIELALVKAIYNDDTAALSAVSGGFDGVVTGTEDNDPCNSFSKEFAPNVAFGGNANVTLSWEWPFETTGNDANDTALGNATQKATVSIAYQVSAEQIGDANGAV